MLTQVNYSISQLVQYKTCSSVQEIKNLIAPFAIGINNNGMNIPSPSVLRGNHGCQAWCNLMTMYNMDHFNYWLSACNHNNSTPLSIFLTQIPSTHCIARPLPCVFFSDVQFHVTCKAVHITELVNEYNMQTVNDLLQYIWTIVGVGIFINDFMVQHVFEIEDIEKYLASRLFAGEVDYLLSMGSSVSSFLSMFPTSGSSYDSYPFMATMESGVGDMVMLIQKEKQVIQNSTFLGNETAQVIAMQDALDLPPDYRAYIQKESNMEKVGPQLFSQIIHGTLLAAPQRGYPIECFEMKQPIYVGPSSSINAVTRNSPQYLPLFAGSGTAICDFGGSSGLISNTLNNFHANDIRLI